MKSDPTRHRDMCYLCHKAKVVCICDRIEKVPNRTAIHILQHIGERDHAVGTVRIAQLGLANVAVETVLRTDDGRFEARTPDDTAGMGLLYPAPGAVDLAALPPAERPSSLVVLDGTWPQAKSLYRDNPWLHALPHYQLTPEKPGNYRIRMEPSDTSLSTVEAIALALRALEPHTPDIERLLNAFDGMVDDQLAYLEKRGPHTWRQKRPRTKEQRSIPTALRDSLEGVVVAYGEAIPWGEQHGERDLISWTAVRLGDQQMFEAFLRPTHDNPHLEWLLEKVGIAPDTFQAACISHEELAKRWTAFFNEDNTLVTWNKGSLQDFFRIVNKPASYQFLKAAYGNLRKEKCGHLEDVVAREGLSIAPLPFAGRAKERLGSAMAVTHFLNQWRK